MNPILNYGGPHFTSKTNLGVAPSLETTFPGDDQWRTRIEIENLAGPRWDRELDTLFEKSGTRLRLQEMGR